MSTSKSVGKSILPTAGERCLAALIDLAIVGVFSLIPILGWLVGAAYFFLKDALVFMDGQSVGKRVMKMRVVAYPDLISIKNDYRSSAMRQITLILPIFNIIDMLMVFSTDRRRFGDQLSGTMVIKEN